MQNRNDKSKPHFDAQSDELQYPPGEFISTSLSSCLLTNYLSHVLTTFVNNLWTITRVWQRNLHASCVKHN